MGLVLLLHVQADVVIFILVLIEDKRIKSSAGQLETNRIAHRGIIGEQQIDGKSWVCKVDRKSARRFYYAIEDKVAQWDQPVGWDQRVIVATGEDCAKAEEVPSRIEWNE